MGRDVNSGWYCTPTKYGWSERKRSVTKGSGVTGSFALGIGTDTRLETLEKRANTATADLYLAVYFGFVPEKHSEKNVTSVER